MAVNVYLDVSLSNWISPICVDENFQHIVYDPSTEYHVKGCYHPDGDKACDAWIAEHQELLEVLIGQVENRESGDFDPSQYNPDLITMKEEEPASEVLPPEPEDNPAVVNSEADQVSETAEAEQEPTETEQESESLSNSALLEAGIPESLTDELLSEGLDTVEKVLEYEKVLGLETINGIGPKARTRILSAINPDAE